MEKEQIIQKLKSLKLNLEVHPDTQDNSEFADRIDDLDEIIQSLTEPTQKKGLDLEALEKKLDEALAKETTESLNEWLSKFREDNPLPTQDGVVSAEECLENVFRNTKFRPRYFEKESGVYYHKEIVLQAMHTYASQTRGEENQHFIKKDVVFDFIEWLEKEVWTNLEHRANGNITKTPLWYNTYKFEACKEPKTLDELYQEYLKQK